MEQKRAEDTNELHLAVGERVALESLRQSVSPPYVMITPFLETPDGIEVESQEGLGEDGVHGSIFHLRADKPVTGRMVVGFRDFKTHKVTHQKAIKVEVE